MRCPVCEQALPVQAPLCPHCGFELAHADKAFGVVQPLKPDITDLANVLKESDLRDLAGAIEKANHPFPQLKISAVIVRLPDNLPLRAITFWLFNRGMLASPLESGAACRLLLFVIDVHVNRATCMAGYGLEPFLPEETLARIVETAQPALTQKAYANALKAMLAKAVSELKTVGTVMSASAPAKVRGAQSVVDADEFVY